MRQVRAVGDGDRKYVGFCPAGKRRVNGEIFEWPDGRGMPEVVRNEDGLIVRGWVELVSGEDGGAPAKSTKPVKQGIPGLVDGKSKTQPRAAVDGNDLSRKRSDRIIG